MIDIKVEDDNKELLKNAIVNKLGIQFPFYLLHVYSHFYDRKEDERAWFIEPYIHEDEQYYGSDRIKETDIEEFGINQVLSRISKLKRFKSKSRAKYIANKLNDWNGNYDLEVGRIDKVEDLFL